MSGSDQGSEPSTFDVVGLLAAFVLCSLIVGVVTYSTGRQDEQQHQQAIATAKSGDDHRRRPRQADTDRAGVPAFAERIISNPEPANADEREKRDLAAQENTAAWAFWIVVLTGGQLLLSGFGLFALLLTIKQGRDANEIARVSNDEQARIGMAQTRAYISITPKGASEPSAGTIEVELDYLNSGQSPARRLHIELIMFDTGMIKFWFTAMHPAGDLAAQQSRQTKVGIKFNEIADQLIRPQGMATIIVRAHYTDIFSFRRRDEFQFTLTCLRHQPPSIRPVFAPDRG